MENNNYKIRLIQIKWIVAWLNRMRRKQMFPADLNSTHSCESCKSSSCNSEQSLNAFIYLFTNLSVWLFLYVCLFFFYCWWGGIPKFRANLKSLYLFTWMFLTCVGVHIFKFIKIMFVYVYKWCSLKHVFVCLFTWHVFYLFVFYLYFSRWCIFI